MIDLADARAYLAAQFGAEPPAAQVSDAIGLVAEVEPAMVAAGYTPERMRLIQRAAVALVAIAGEARRVAQQGSASGASRAYKVHDRDLAAARRAVLAWDTARTVEHLLPPEPDARRAMLMVV